MLAPPLRRPAGGVGEGGLGENSGGDVLRERATEILSSSTNWRVRATLRAPEPPRRPTDDAAQRKRRCPSRLRLRRARGRSSRSPAPRAPRSSAHGAVRARRSAEEEPGPASGRAGDPAWPAASLPGACPAGDGCGIRAGLCAGLQGGWRRRVSGHQVSRGDAQMPAGPCGLSSAVLRASGVLYRPAWRAALSSRSPPASRATLSSRDRRMRPSAA